MVCVCVSVYIQGVSRLQGITAGDDFLGLCDQKSSYKHVSDFAGFELVIAILGKSNVQRNATFLFCSFLHISSMRFTELLLIEVRQHWCATVCAMVVTTVSKIM